MSNLVFFLEEPSAGEMLKGLLPRMLPDNFYFRCVIFEGKQDLEKQLERKLRAWQMPDTRFIVLRDKDSGDCRKIKEHLANICHKAGKPDTLIRIACHELESWYLGNLQAVDQGLQINGLSAKQNKRSFREPDRLANPSQVLNNLTKGLYQKVSGSRNIGPFLSLEQNCSHSFNVFLAGVRRTVGI